MSSILEEIRPETAHRLRAAAKRMGLSVDDLLSRLIPDIDSDSDANQPFYKTATAGEWSHELRVWSASHPIRDTFADDSRESIY